MELWGHSMLLKVFTILSDIIWGSPWFRISLIILFMNQIPENQLAQNSSSPASAGIHLDLGNVAQGSRVGLGLVGMEP
jgi:hypothetical protein